MPALRKPVYYSDVSCNTLRLTGSEMWHKQLGTTRQVSGWVNMAAQSKTLIVRRRGVQIAEFSLVPLVLFLLAIPVIDLFGIAISYGYLAYSTFACVNKAAISADYDTALAGMNSQAVSMLAGPFASFLKLSPLGGYQGCGCDLFVANTDIATGDLTVVGPNKALSAPPNSETTASEYQVVSTCSAGPLIPLGLPVLKDIPMLGADTTLSVKWSRMAENQEGLARSTNTVATDGGVSDLSLNVPGLENISSLGKFTASSWKDPRIYEYIAAQGDTAQNQDVLVIYANNSNWYESEFFIYPTYKVYIDYKASGHWKFAPGQMQKDADGADVQKVGSNWVPISGPGDTGYMLIQFGNCTPMRVGNNKLITPNGSGIMKFLACDKDGNVDAATGSIANPEAYTDNVGSMKVRVIIAY